MHHLTFLIDTGSQVTIIASVAPRPDTPTINLEGVQGIETPAHKECIRIKIYDRNVEIDALFFPAPIDILGMDVIPCLVDIWIPLKRLKSKMQVCLSTVKMPPVELPKIPPTYTKQYPLKGGHQEIDVQIGKLLQEGIIERTQSFSYNSPIWPVIKPNGSYRFTIDYRNINKNTPSMPGSVPEVEAIFNDIVRYHPKFFATIDLQDMFFGIPLHPNSREYTTFTNVQYQFT